MRRAASVAMAAVLLTAGLIAQSKPNFTGKWTQSDPDPAAAAAGGGRGRGGMGGWGTNPVISQDATSLTVDYSAAQNPAKFVVKLDGSESKNSTARGGQTMESVSKATWEGNKLVITTSQEFNGNKFETKRELWLEGGNLIVQTTPPAFQGNAATPTKVTYKKS